MDKNKPNHKLEISSKTGLVKSVHPTFSEENTQNRNEEGDRPECPGDTHEKDLLLLSPSTLDGQRTGDCEINGCTEDLPIDVTFTRQQTSQLFSAICEGDIEVVTELLNLPGARLDITWYGQNMLTAAIHTKQRETAKFLIDIGVDINFCTSILDRKDDQIDIYELSCRQIAYNNDMMDVVDIIDYKNGYKNRFRDTKTRKPFALDEQTKVNLEKTSLLRTESESSIKSNDTPTDTSYTESVNPDDNKLSPNDFPSNYVPNPVWTPLFLKNHSNDEGYISTSPKSSTRSSPVSPSNGYLRHIECFTDNNAVFNYKQCFSHGSYLQESSKWTFRPSPKTNDENKVDIYPAGPLRSDYPAVRDSKYPISRRQRRLPATATSVSTHRPRIMSPPSSEGTPKASRMLLQTNIVTLPNKLSFIALPNTLYTTENLKNIRTTTSKSRQIPYGKNNKPSINEPSTSKKYDECFVTDIPKNNSCKRHVVK